ncbi:MAG: type VI secretion system ATPase TssH [Thiobacillus sp.]|nr:type VI secretion system ATPase TssH [Thiobacillus sp.]
MSINLKTLISKLNSTCRAAAERAVKLCVTRGHYEVEMEHLFLALLDSPQNDIGLLLKRYEISSTALERDLHREIAGFKSGNSRTPVFSEHLPKLLEHAWLLASLDTQTTRIRSGHLLLALLTENELSQMALRSSPLFAKISVDELKHKLDELTARSEEAEASVALSGTSGGTEEGDASQVPVDGALGKTPALDQFTNNLTQRAKEGKIDPVIGRESEIRQTIDILLRRRQNNPILTGEAGVGKTAVVEGLAQRIASGDVPPPLQGVALHVLDLGLLQAGASVKGEFENRLKNVITEVKRSPHPIILFIDEAHTMIGAGGQAGQNDAANLLKPALARGELRTIAATTWSEYKKYFEKDAALARRFQVVKIEEPSESIACSMLRGMVPLMESHFGIRVLDSAVEDAVRLSARYITGRQLPDKAISVLDTACARVALAQNATPAAIEDIQKKLDRLAQETTALQKEQATGSAHEVRLKALLAERDALQAELTAQQSHWEKERELVKQIAGLMKQLETASHETEASADTAAAKKKPVKSASGELKALSKLREELSALQAETPLMPVCVDAQIVGEIISGWTGIPLGKMIKDEIKTVLSLSSVLTQRVMGQDHAIEAIAQRVRTARANLEDPNKPKGVFLFVGPSGVGKTETALALADVLYGGERNVITINMSEYQEAHTVSGLKGSPPGYVGYGEGGVLTEAVRRRPYSVVLLDEIEKAHPDVLEMFFQVFDKGVMDDAEGREIDFRNTLIILTSNVASSQIMQACLNKVNGDVPDAATLEEIVRPHLYKAFKPAFLGRMKVIPYYPIADDVLERIIHLKLGRIKSRVVENHKADFSYDQILVDTVLSRCTEVDTGARNVDHILNGTLLPEIAESVLTKMAEGSAIKKIKVSASKQGKFSYRVS